MDQLRRRLEDTERAMERLMSQMGSVSDKLTAAKITEVLSQAQAQAKLLKVSRLGWVDSHLQHPIVDWIRAVLEWLVGLCWWNMKNKYPGITYTKVQPIYINGQ